jgi:riboflavin-specific deaminase-like protein
MLSRAAEAPLHDQASAEDSAWSLLRAASALAERLEREGCVRAFGAGGRNGLRALAADDPRAVLAWVPGSGWQSRVPPDDPRSELLNLYLPICGATSARPMTVGHLGQSLDGFIATLSGDSHFVTGGDNIVHLHRMRALCDAVVVGAGTVAADDPQLTTRHVSGPNPLRVVLDPGRRLAADYRVFTDPDTPTLYVCGRSRLAPGESRIGHATIAGIDNGGPAEDAAQALQLLRARGCARVFVEGGGVTVSAFLEANLLDRLQIAIAPVLIGNGRPAIRLTPHAHLRDCRRPGYRVFRMGGDVLFDCELNVRAEQAEGPAQGTVNQII